MPESDVVKISLYYQHVVAMVGVIIWQYGKDDFCQTGNLLDKQELLFLGRK
jgi:hypothetical protein